MTIETTTARPRGGMCSNPFGGHDRLDRIDFNSFASGSTTGESLLYLAVITQAVNDYLYFGLGRNGTTAEEFWFASEYLFNIRSYDDSLLDESRTIRNTYSTDVDGIRTREVQTVTLSDVELQSMCFDRQYVAANLHHAMQFDTFVAKLVAQRLDILAANWQQVIAYLKPDQSLSIDAEMRLLAALVNPSDPDEFVAALSLGGGHE